MDVDFQKWKNNVDDNRCGSFVDLYMSNFSDHDDDDDYNDDGVGVGDFQLMLKQ